MSSLPSLYDYESADRVRDIDQIAEHVRSDLHELESDGAAHTARHNVRFEDVPSPAPSSSSEDVNTNIGGGDFERSHLGIDQSDLGSHTYSPVSQTVYSPHSSAHSPGHSLRYPSQASNLQAQSQSNGSTRQPLRLRQTPASNFAALFPPPRAVTSVTTSHASNPSQSGQINPSRRQHSSALPTSAPSLHSSPYLSHHLQPRLYSQQVSGIPGNSPSFATHPLTPNSIGSSLSNPVSSASRSLVSSRPSSRAASVSACTPTPGLPSSSLGGSTSSLTLPSRFSGGPPFTNASHSEVVGDNASVTGVRKTQAFDPTLPTFSASGFPIWPAASSQSTSPSNQAKNYQSPSTDPTGLPPYTNTYSPTSVPHPIHSLQTGSRHISHYAFEDHQENGHEIKLANGFASARERSREYLRNREVYGKSPQASFGEGSPYPTYTSSSVAGTASHSHRNLSGSGAGLVTRGLLVPFAAQHHSSSIDRQKGELTSAQRSGNQLAHHPSGETTPVTKTGRNDICDNVGTMSGSNMYHADVDMDPLESYDEDDIPSNLPQHNASTSYSAMSMTGESRKDDKQVRRRSSKACDQCRKSKCKCERTADGEPCKSCVMLGTPCTFLGPSRKRGPPKGYIDAIESRLHQTEALVGILLALANPERGVLDGDEPKPDERSRSLLEDLRNNDPLAREIVDRVDRGAYGTKGRRNNASFANINDITRAGSGTSGDERSAESAGTAKEGHKSVVGETSIGLGVAPPSVQGRGRMVGLGQEMEMNGLLSSHPSNEWQDTVTERIKVAVRSRTSGQGSASLAIGYPTTSSSIIGKQHFPQDIGRRDERERQRRRLGPISTTQHVSEMNHSPERLTHPRSAHRQSVSSISGTSELVSPLTSTNAARYSPPVVPVPSYASSTLPYGHVGFDGANNLEESENVEDQEGITDGVGQLSINEEAQVRFHGKASGLHLLGQKLRLDGRNKGGIWRFPKARVWPPVASMSTAHMARIEEAEACERAVRACLPQRGVQEHLIELYFAHVHPFLPIVHKETFLSDFRAMWNEQGGNKISPDVSDSRGRNGGTSRNTPRGERSTSTGHTGSTLAASTESVDMPASEPSSQLPPRIPTLLLLAMFSIAARYALVAHGTSVGNASSPYQLTIEEAPSADTPLSFAVGDASGVAKSSSTKIPGPGLGGSEANTANNSFANSADKADTESTSEIDSDAALPLPQSGHMWAAGDGYLERAKILLDRTYGSSRPSTCQALLLMGYREIGIGAMAQSWLYVGMAVRMAQDLGMHRSSDAWSCGAEPIFSSVEKQVRKRIWYACVIMDKYVSTYIGRPLSIFESDYDTQLPGVEDTEELELWEPHSSMPNSVLTDPIEAAYAPLQPFTPVPGRVLSCFNESARLSSILAMIVQAIYAVKPVPSRHLEALQLERTLDRWYMDLPEYLCYDTSVKSASVPPPNVLTLHMQYWCAVLLLHRPFIRNYIAMRRKRSTNPESPIDLEGFSAAQKNFDLCVSAANHITSIVSVYQDHLCLKRCAVFLSYYVFSAGIMHMTTMTTNPHDPQASLGLHKCMDVLKRMEIVWPSAGRAWELLHGAKDDLFDYELPFPLMDRPRKRSADDPLDAVPIEDSSYLHMTRSAPSIPSQVHTPSASNGHRYGATIDIGESEPPIALYNSYNRWSPDGLLGFPSGLSTSVLPQQYSTGLLDDRVPPSIRRSHSGMVDDSGRYPQYWSDYSMGQPSSMLGSMYGMPMLSHQSHHLQPSQHHHQESHQHHHLRDSPSMYMNEQYNVFSSS
ncbi:fungal-specific transcription factor domain-containing protein [Phellopilus nigrolimitatus]|nr:fungal-specific transcription factor domain-containing protein [Phellopilus nigrolimitatus]